MRIQCRTAIATASLVALVFSSAAVASAEVGPILSGYGGPGSGSQVILGATLIGGSGGQGSGGAGGGGSITVAAAAPAGATHSAQPSGGANPAQGAHPSGGSDGHAQVPAGKGTAVRPGQPAEAITVSSTNAQAIGLIGGNKLLLLLVLVGLVLTGLLTKGASRPGGRAVAAQGRAPTPRRDT